jgi:hypothetical protein
LLGVLLRIGSLVSELFLSLAAVFGLAGVESILRSLSAASCSHLVFKILPSIKVRLRRTLEKQSYSFEANS